MADEEELYLANLDEFVNDENRIVTYKWLSRTLSVSANRAKQMLYAFVQKQKKSNSGSDINVTYLIGGRCSVDGDMVHRFVITQDEKLEETKKNFSFLSSLHIYSVQKCKLKDANALYTVDYDVQQQYGSETNRWSHIYCSAAVPLADKGVNRGTHHVNGARDGHGTKMTNGTGEVHSSSRGASNSAFDQKTKTATSKPKKGQMPTMEMFSAKSTTKNDKHIGENPPAEKNGRDYQNDQAKPNNSNKSGSMMSFFGKSISAKKVSEKPSSTGNEKEFNRHKGKKASDTAGDEAELKPAKSQTAPKKQDQAVENQNSKKRELSSEDEEEPLPSKISKVVNSSAAGSKDSKNDKQKQKEGKQVDISKSKAGKKKAVTNEESDEEREAKPKKRRKRTKELPKEDSSDDEQDMPNRDVIKKLPPDQRSSASVSPPPQQLPQQTESGTARRRKRTRALKDKTYMNDEGFMVTEKVWETDSTDASDGEPQRINPTEKEKQPSPAKKIIKKTCADVKNKAARQSSLTSFFKKS